MKNILLCATGICFANLLSAQDGAGQAPDETTTGEYTPVEGKFLPDAEAENKNFAKELKKVFGGRLTHQERIKRLEENGGNKECEKAITKSLKWMKKRQNDDGSWEGQHKVAMTGLALLSYLGHGEIPGVEGPYEKTVTDAVQYLIGVSQKNGGLLTENPKDKGLAYEHAIAVYALSEAYILGITQGNEIKALPEVIIAGADRIVKGQAEDGTWGYHLQKSGDLSIIAWCLQALKAVSHTGLNVEGLGEAARRGMVAVNEHQMEDGSSRYKPESKQGSYLTGAAVLCHQQWGSGRSSAAELGVNWIDSNVTFTWSPSKLYHHYYMSQAMFEYGGIKWIQYNKSFRDTVLAQQNQDGAFSGGREPKKPLAKGIAKYGEEDSRMKLEYTWQDHYHSCLATLMLEVYFRYLPGTNER